MITDEVAGEFDGILPPTPANGAGKVASSPMEWNMQSVELNIDEEYATRLTFIEIVDAWDVVRGFLNAAATENQG